MKPVITFTSDFGDDFAKSQVEAVIYSLNPEVQFIVASNAITPFSIIEGSFVLQNFYTLTPPGSIHLAVVDPGVGSSRKPIIIQTKDFTFVGPDNGVLVPAASENGIQKVFVIDEERFSKGLSKTFHGRDLFAKAAGLISLGSSLQEFAIEDNINSLKNLNLEENMVLHIDPFGNIKVHKDCASLQPGDTLRLSAHDCTLELPFVMTFSDVLPNEFLAYRGSHNTLEIAKNLGSANQELGLRVGEVINIEKVPRR